MQALLREAAGSDIGRNDKQMLDQVKMPWFGEMNRGLRDVLSEAQFEARVRQYADMLEALADTIRTLVATRADASTLDLFAVIAALVPQEQALPEAEIA